MRARALAADGEGIAAELIEVLAHPQRRGFAVVRAGGIGMLWREAVLDADGRQPRAVRKLLQQGVLLISSSEHPAAAVDVQVRAPRARWRDSAQSDSACRPVD